MTQSTASPPTRNQQAVPQIKLGRILSATIICADLEIAAAPYLAALGFRTVETGRIDAALGQSWNAGNLTGARYQILQPPSAGESYLRLIEDRSATPPPPYSTLGWTALEFSVKSSDAIIGRLEDFGLRVLGPAADLDFSEGRLRAGQVLGPSGEILYLTQINDQVDGFTLPIAKNDVETLFIAVLVANSVERTTSKYERLFQTIDKGAFESQVAFIAGFQGLPSDHKFQFGCVETVPESYVEIDAMPSAVQQRGRPDGHLPSGIAMITFECEDITPLLAPSASRHLPQSGKPYEGCRSVLVTGPAGELIEIIERTHAH